MYRYKKCALANQNTTLTEVKTQAALCSWPGCPRGTASQCLSAILRRDNFDYYQTHLTQSIKSIKP